MPHCTLQVILAQDTFQGQNAHVAIKILNRQCQGEGIKVSLYSSPLWP